MARQTAVGFAFGLVCLLLPGLRPHLAAGASGNVGLAFDGDTPVLQMQSPGGAPVYVRGGLRVIDGPLVAPGTPITLRYSVQQLLRPHGFLRRIQSQDPSLEVIDNIPYAVYNSTAPDGKFQSGAFAVDIGALMAARWGQSAPNTTVTVTLGHLEHGPAVTGHNLVSVEDGRHPWGLGLYFGGKTSANKRYALYVRDNTNAAVQVNIEDPENVLQPCLATSYRETRFRVDFVHGAPVWLSVNDDCDVRPFSPVLQVHEWAGRWNTEGLLVAFGGNHRAQTQRVHFFDIDVVPTA